jgi:hypothetical protein
MKRTLDITILGKLWMGGDASTSLSVTVGEGPFQVQFDNPTDLNEVLSYVDTHSGDFSQIIAVEATYRESNTTLVDSQQAGNQTYTETRIIAREIQLSTFTEKEEERYLATLDGFDYEECA